MHHYLGGILKHLDCQPVIVGGVEDHVHLLASLSRTCRAAEMVNEVKKQHHRKLSLQDEFRLLLKRYEPAYDERFVWD